MKISNPIMKSINHINLKDNFRQYVLLYYAFKRVYKQKRIAYCQQFILFQIGSHGGAKMVRVKNIL